MAKANSNESVTGRDGYIMAQALYWAIKFSESLPDEFREWSNEQDMKALLTTKFPLFVAGFSLGDTWIRQRFEDLKASGANEYYGRHYIGDEIDAVIAHFTPPNLFDGEWDAEDDGGVDAAPKSIPEFEGEKPTAARAA